MNTLRQEIDLQKASEIETGNADSINPQLEEQISQLETLLVEKEKKISVLEEEHANFEDVFNVEKGLLFLLFSFCFFLWWIAILNHIGT